MRGVQATDASATVGVQEFEVEGHAQIVAACGLAFAEATPQQAGAFDVVVAGAGAAGLVAALRAAERGRRTLLLEKNKKPGVKILMSGGTRCNITHATDNRGIVEAYGPPGRFLHSALAALSVEDTVTLFEAEGVATKVEETGKIFPVSNKATDVLAALLRRLERSGATLALGEPLLDGRKVDEGFEVVTPLRAVTATNVVLTTGGQSYPGSGTTGDGYRIAAQFGHTIVPPRPALVPLTVAPPWVADLRGITLPDVGLRILDDGEVLAARRGSLLLAHFGLSGPVVLDVSRVVSGHCQPQRLLAEIDLLPELREEALSDWLRAEAAAAGKRQLAGILATKLPRRLCDTLLTLVGLPIDRPAAGMRKDERARLVQVVKHLAIPLTGTLGFKKAEVTAGGVSLDEVDSRTMRSKKIAGLYLAGEILDLDGPIGGYNFQAAWSTGWLAGSSV
jgi:predicted Rossmann fold flavoprotein